MNSKQWRLQLRDEYYTPKYLVKPIIKYLPKNATIWCPFDTANSEYVIELRKAGHTVIHSHIADGQDFFTYIPSQDFDFVISNPPFSLKKDILIRLYSIGKPFALLLGLPILNYNEIQDVFITNNSEVQLLMFNKKSTFDGNPSSFNSSYFCYNFLPKDIICEKLEIQYKSSSMEQDRNKILSCVSAKKKKDSK